AAVLMAIATNSHVPGCEGCPFTTTGQPLAKADAVSPPATENANGKLLAPKTPTTPKGFCMYRISERGDGSLSGMAVSILASTHEPSLTTVANNFHCPTVLARSLITLGTGKPVSAEQRSIQASQRFKMSSAMVSKNKAFSFPLFFRYMVNAS